MDAPGQEAFRRVLRTHRLAAGLTQQELAERSGISTRSVSDLERGISQHPRRDTAAMLADGLDLAARERELFLSAARPRRAPSPFSDAVPHAPLPDAPGPLLGRERELQSIAAALQTRELRLLSLTGPGGVGKTRLAIDVARRMADRFRDGAAFVRLDGLTDAALVLPTLASAMQLLETGDRDVLLDRVAAHLASRELLLILDNMEHLLSAAGDIGDLARRSLTSVVLVTSREALRVRGEQIITLAPLPRPNLDHWRGAATHSIEESPAVRLFVQRAVARRPDLAVDPTTAAGRANLAVIAETCHRLDGLPLAIELAAAQAEMLSPAAILALLKRAGLPLLAGGDRDQPARLQTMDAAISWSYTLLSTDEQALFRALSTFAGGFTLAAASAIADPNGFVARQPDERDDPLADFNPASIRTAPAGPAFGQLINQLDPVAGLQAPQIEALTSLARQNLLIQDTSAPDGAPSRFRMLEPLRLFALDRLRASGEEREVRLRHARFFARTAETLDALTLGPDPEIWLQQQVADLDNFRAAQDWALALGEDDLTVRITAYIAQLWLITGLHAEGRQRVSSAIAVDAGSDPAIRWYLRFWAGTFAIERGDRVMACAYARQMLEIADAHGDLAGRGVGLTLHSRAVGASAKNRGEAAELARQAVDVLAPLGQGEWTGWAWSRLGIELHRLGRLDEARDCLRQSLEARRLKGCEGCASYTLALLGAVLLDLGQPAAAVDAYRECLDLTVKHGNLSLMLAALTGFADAAWRYGLGPCPERSALAFFGAAEALRRRHGFDPSAAERQTFTRWQAPMRRALGDETVDGLIHDGQNVPLSEIVEAAYRLEVSPDCCPPVPIGGKTSLVAALGSIE